MMLLIFSLVISLSVASAHVALTFPPARQYQLDFLDNARTPAPCGMPKGNIKTTLPGGRPVNITWHLAYPHRGGHKLELLDSQENIIQDLSSSSSSSGYVVGDTTAQNEIVALPESCEDCSIRLMRQASEWGDRYKFWSCADVDIVPQQSYSLDCGNGQLSGGKCSCNTGYHGDRCQYQNECETDEDCSNYGRCTDIDSTTYPKRMCFCAPGYHGTKCTKRSSFDTTEVDRSQYSKRSLSDDFTLYWKLLEETREIEMIMEMNGIGYAAIGWRPAGISRSCKQFPFGSGNSKYVPKGDFHAMDCTDIVIGVARGPYSRILDYYTRDRSTPRVDEFWGGEDDVTSAVGHEKDGVTTIRFKRSLTGNEATDHNIEVDKPMHFIWAKGQEPGRYIHRPKSGLEVGDPSVENFYRPDELKYHGHQQQRGVLTMNLKASDSDSKDCGGEFKSPSDCTPGNCQYRATWRYNPSDNDISFMVQTSDVDKWTGIGFSEDQRMAKSDVILGWVNSNGHSVVKDTWLSGYIPPEEDAKQDISKASAVRENGVLTLRFSRPFNTGDNQKDLMFGDKCLYMMYPVGGGNLLPGGRINKHKNAPIVSNAPICIKKCTSGTTTSGITSRRSRIKFRRFKVELHVLASGMSPREKPSYDRLLKEINQELHHLFKQIPEIQEAKVIKLKTFKPGVTAIVDVYIKEPKQNSLETLERKLRVALASGRSGKLYLDTTTLKITAYETGSLGEPEGEFEYSPEGEAEYSPEGEAEGHAAYSPEGEGKFHYSPKAEAEYHGEPEGEAEYKYKGKPEAEYHGEPEGEAEYKYKGKPEPEYHGEPEGEAKYKYRGKPEAEYHGEPEGEAEYKYKGKLEVEYQGEPEGKAEYHGKPEYEGKPKLDIRTGLDKQPKLSNRRKYLPAEPEGEPERG